MTIHTKVTAAKAQIGLGHGLALATPVLSLDGLMPVEYLTVGERIITRLGALRLRAIETQVVQNARVVRIAQGVLGVDRPEADMMVTPDQPILIRDWRAKALTGQAVALIPAQRLVDGSYICAEVLAEVRLFTLRFDEDAVIYAGGLELACTGLSVAA